MNVDLAKHAALKAVIKKGKFEIEGEAIQAVAALFKWYDELESKLKETPAAVEPPTASFKPIGVPKPIKGFKK